MAHMYLCSLLLCALAGGVYAVNGMYLKALPIFREITSFLSKLFTVDPAITKKKKKKTNMADHALARQVHRVALVKQSDRGVSRAGETCLRRSGVLIHPLRQHVFYGFSF